MTATIQAIEPDRIHERIERLAQIGGLPGGGMNRIPYCPEDRVARDLVSSWMADLGLRVHTDAAGNVLGVWPGADPSLPSIMVGSHLDTQPGGGRFDGMAGVVAALEAVQVLQSAGLRFRRTIEVVAWAGEEASGRFDVALIGSRAMVGELRPEHLQERCRLTGRTLGELMIASGLPIAELATAERAPGSIAAVLELHIEQGPYLEEDALPVGVVTNIAGNRRLALTIEGVQAHSGAQPMTHRRDALCAEAEIILAAEHIASAHAAPPVVATSGYSSHFPHVIAAVPGRAEMVIDVRSIDRRSLVQAAAEIAAVAREICDRRGVRLHGPELWGVDPTAMTRDVTEVLTRSCQEVDVPHRTMPSGAGHDSMILGRRFPAGMIFVPSRAGISHAPEEFTEAGDIATGTGVLVRALHELAQEDC